MRRSSILFISALVTIVLVTGWALFDYGKLGTGGTTAARGLDRTTEEMIERGELSDKPALFYKGVGDEDSGVRAVPEKVRP